ncbi:hypothetical protein K7X08_006989 [Anisodus acutangulus]|uniref:Nitrite/Sulfite reductase ferredoxin-like domain-containing protein n=1 Tax=Anisodus acutangulus TaxID=402998 RepID=A0A9Q1LF78_9SOLA|nr:hypothetical protein K7X08_006989 [Anisodus acutangulus]
MDELARLADEYGSGDLRLTVEQNIIIPNIENSKIALLNEPLLKNRFSPDPPILMRNLVACTGNQFCGQAIIETKARSMKITEEVQRLVSVTQPEGKPVEGADVFLGGRIGSDSHLGDVYKKSVPCEDLVPIIVDLLVKNFGAVPREREMKQKSNLEISE